MSTFWEAAIPGFSRKGHTMNKRLRWGRPNMLVVALGAVIPCAGAVHQARAETEIGRVTLMAGMPRMVGESIRPLQAVYSGRVLETGEEDAAGLLVDDVVIHIGSNSEVTVLEEPGGKRILVEKGYVVVYTEPDTETTVVAETPFGRLISSPGLTAEEASGWFSIRHDPEQANISPAVSTFAAMEGAAQVAGIVPEAGPYLLQAGQRWRIVDGQIPGAPEEGDERNEADELRQRLHREAAEIAHADAINITGLTAADLIPQSLPEDVIEHEGQFIIDTSSANQDRLPLEYDTFDELILPEIEVVYAIASPRVIPAGTPDLATAQFVGIDGIPADPAWNEFLTDVDGNPAFQPTYLTQFANGGFSYIQFAGAGAELVDSDGETFLAAEANALSGWAIYTPQMALGDSDFDPDSRLVAVVTDGIEAIALGEHLSGNGAIGGDGVDTDSAFAVISDGDVEFNPDQPAGYPLLDQAGDTTGLTVGGEAVSDQIAALGSGQDPQQLDQVGPQLIFLSDGETDANGSAFNFTGDAIAPTELDLPGDRTVQTDNSGAAGLATPLGADLDNTVGLQFAATGSTIAIVHHSGMGNPSGAGSDASDHFEVVRGDRYTIIQWRADARVTGADGELLELEDLNDYPELRNELFALIGEEVNELVPSDTLTAFGPAMAQTDPSAPRQLRRTPGRLVRTNDGLKHRGIVIRSGHSRATTRILKSRSLSAGGGRLIRELVTPPTRRHIGRVTPR